jgi:hypothetical protein
MLKFHHIGCLSENIDDSMETYKKLYNTDKVSRKIFIESQGVYVCFVEMPGGGFLELIQPVNEDSVVARLKKKGFTYYHIGYWVKNVKETITELESLDFKFINIFQSEAFGGRTCAFLYSPEMHLIEIMEEE